MLSGTFWGRYPKRLRFLCVCSQYGQPACLHHRSLYLAHCCSRTGTLLPRLTLMTPTSPAGIASSVRSKEVHRLCLDNCIPKVSQINKTPHFLELIRVVRLRTVEAVCDYCELPPLTSCRNGDSGRKTPAGSRSSSMNHCTTAANGATSHQPTSPAPPLLPCPVTLLFGYC